MEVLHGCSPVTTPAVDCSPFQKAEGKLQVDWQERKISGFIPANTGNQLKIKGMVDENLKTALNIIQIGDTFNRDYRFAFTELQGNYSELSDRWGCRFILEMKLDGYYGDLTDQF